MILKSASLRWLMILGLLLVTGFAHAEDGCPPGFVPTGAPPSPQDPGACRPTDDNNQQQIPRPPPPIWGEKYGAIATDLVRKSGGISVNESSQSSAEQAAIARCQANGGIDCKVEIAYGNGCVALVGGDKGHNAKAGLTIDLATQAAMKVCNAGDTHCQVTYTACSLPVRVQ